MQVETDYYDLSLSKTVCRLQIGRVERKLWMIHLCALANDYNFKNTQKNRSVAMEITMVAMDG